MKAQILKMAKCKNESEFYKKFPSEEAFMKVYGKQFKKALLGEAMPKITPRNLPTGLPFENLDTKTLDDMNIPVPKQGFDIGSLINPGMKIGEGIANLIEEKKKKHINYFHTLLLQTLS